GAVVAYLDVDALAVIVDGDLDRARPRGRADMHGIVEQVAEDRHDIGGARVVQPGEPRRVGQRYVDAELLGGTDLRDQQRCNGRIVDDRRHRVADSRTPAGEGADEPLDIVVLAELHQPGDGVQLVGELVGL